MPASLINKAKKMTKFNLRSRDYLNTPERKQIFNRYLFSAIAPEYGAMSKVLSLGRDRVWKRKMIDALPDIRQPQCLDLACGNGDLTELLMEKYPDCNIIALDLAEPMLKQADKRLGPAASIQFLQKDMADTGLPAEDFHLITVGYGLRNAPDINGAFCEIQRLLAPNGIVAVLDFSRFNNPLCADMELHLLALWCGMWGLLRSGNPDTYGYIAESLSRFPNRSELHEKFAAHGLKITRSKRHFFGITETIIATKRV